MDKRVSMHTRRRFLHHAALGAAALATPGALAEALQQTPRQTAGPFFPDRLPLDTDNDLLVLNDNLNRAVGEVTYLNGHILDANGDPVRDALVEIWQVDHNGIYIHSDGGDRDALDGNFQGYGRFLTSSTGEYQFRTIKPVAYGAGRGTRTPHIHYAVQVPGQKPFTTQCYVKGDPLNERDGILNSIRDAKARESVIVDFKPLENGRGGELTAHFDIVLGHTPEA